MDLEHVWNTICLSVFRSNGYLEQSFWVQPRREIHLVIMCDEDLLFPKAGPVWL